MLSPTFALFFLDLKVNVNGNNILRTNKYRAFLFDLLIIADKKKWSLIIYCFTKSKVNVTLVIFMLPKRASVILCYGAPSVRLSGISKVSSVSQRSRSKWPWALNPCLLNHFKHITASFTLSRCTPKCVPAVCSWRTGARGQIMKKFECVHTCPAVLRTRPSLGQKSSWCVPGMLQFAMVHSRCSPGSATVCPGASRYTTALPRHRRQSPRVTMASHGSRTAKPRSFTVAYTYQWNSDVTSNRYVICKVQNSA